jgi:hypothetical protein
MTALEELKDVVGEGLVSDILKMERAYHILFFIGNNADKFNDRTLGNFGELFGAFQGSLEVDAVLAAARIYDAPSNRYPTRCLRRALSLMEERVEELPEIAEPYNTKLSLAFLGETSDALDSVDSGRDKFVAKFVPAFRQILDSDDVLQAVDSLKYVRDKRIAHNEAAEPHGPTWEALNSLVKHAQNFVGVVGWAFLSTAYVNDGTYFLTSDARRPSNALRRLLERLQHGVNHSAPN